METKKIYLHALQNMEHYQFADRVLKLCVEANLPKLNAILDQLEAAVMAEDEALNLPKASLDTQQMREADERRDKSYRALCLAVDLHLHSAEAETLAAAEAVSHAMSAYPNVVASNYDKETGLIRNLVTDLRAEPLSAHVTKIGATAYVDRLDADNTAFDRIFHERIKAATPSGTYDMKQLRGDTDRALDAVLRRIEALDELESTAATVELITRYNNLVENRRTLLAHRSATSQAARDKRTAQYAALLQPGIPALEERLGLSSGTLSFTGKTEGSGSKRYYELAVAGQTTPEGKPRTLLVGVNKDGSLYPYERVEGVGG